MSDLISRQSAIEAIEQLPNAYNGWSDAYDKAYIIGALEEVPSADRPHGEWIMWENQRDEDVANGNYLYSCSNCGHADVHAKTQSVPYCWYCGARMNKGGEDE